MHNTKRDHIFLMTISAILVIGLAASVPHRQMAASAERANSSQTNRRDVESGGGAQLERINIFSANGKDPRTQVDRADDDARSLLPIGYVENNVTIKNREGESGRGTSTAFLVSPCYAMLNYHAAFGADKNPDPAADHSLTMHLGAGQNGSFRYAITLKPVRWGAFGGGSDDLILAQLEKCAGRKLGWMETAIPDSSQIAGLEVSMAGYPGDLSTAKLTVQHRCTIRRYNSVIGTLQHDCGSRGGSSGSPIYRMVEGKPVVIAVHAFAMDDYPGVIKQYSSDHANEAVSLDFFRTYPEFQDMIEEDIRTFGQPNPATAPATPPKHAPLPLL